MADWLGWLHHRFPAGIWDLVRKDLVFFRSRQKFMQRFANSKVAGERGGHWIISTFILFSFFFLHSDLEIGWQCKLKPAAVNFPWETL